jgi:hypothetical protein
MKESAWRHSFAKSLNQSHAAGTLIVAQGINIPLRAFRLLNADVCRLTALGQPDIVHRKIRVDLARDSAYSEPLLFVIVLKPWPRIVQAPHGHFVAEFGAFPLGGSRDWGGLGST